LYYAIDGIATEEKDISKALHIIIDPGTVLLKLENDEA